MSGAHPIPIRPTTEAPVLDLCVPFWGRPADLYETIASVLAQDDPHWRLIVIDDCYPEDVAPYFDAIDDDRVTYRRNEVNVGVTANYRRAIAAATGSHMVILGSDDVLHPTYVRTMRDVAARHPEADAVQAGVQVIDGDGKAILPLVDRVKLRLLTPKKETTLTGEEMVRSLLVGNWLYWPSLMFRTETIRQLGFRDELVIIQDLALLVDIAFQGGSLHYLPTVCFSYRRHGQSLSQRAVQDGSRFVEERTYYRTTAADCGRKGWRRARRAARFRLLSRLHGVVILPKVLRGGSAAARKAALALTFGS